MLANTLLPQPDAYVIVDRQRASANGFLVAPLAQHNFVELQHLLPKYMFVPVSAIKKYRNLSPANFGVNRNEKPGTALPFYSLFGGGSASVTTGTPVVETGTVNGRPSRSLWFLSCPHRPRARRPRHRQRLRPM